VSFSKPQSRRSRRVSRKAKLGETLAQTYRHVPFRNRVVIAAALLSVCCIVILGASFELRFRAWEPVASAEPAAAPFWPPSSILLPTGHTRTVYPYSVIAGGAQSAQELREAVAVDPVVAQHYADFDIAKTRRVTLDAPKLVYVSYRLGNKVFWTKHKVALRKGEAMLSDGPNMARTRCGNRISVLPVRPNAPAEPSSSELEGPEFAPMVSSPYLAAYSVSPPAVRLLPLCQLRHFFLCRAAEGLSVTRVRLLRLRAVAAVHPVAAEVHLAAEAAVVVELQLL